MGTEEFDSLGTAWGTGFSSPQTEATAHCLHIPAVQLEKKAQLGAAKDFPGLLWVSLHPHMGLSQ